VVLFRSIFPFLSGPANFSLACALQWYLQLSAIAGSKMRAQLGAFNAFVGALSVSVLFVVAATGSSMMSINLCAISSPLVSITSGFVWHACGRGTDAKAHRW